MRKVKNQKIWANAVNLSGLWNKKPMLLKKHHNVYGGTDSWWDKDGDFGVSFIGKDSRRGNITFSSTSKKEVEAWTDGVRDTMTMLQNWSEYGAKK